MGKRQVPTDPCRSSDLPEVLAVDVSVVPEPGTSRPRSHAAVGGSSVVKAIAVLAVVAAAIVATALTLPGSPGRNGHSSSTLARARGPVGIAAAYGYPLACLSITILATNRSYARADFNHMSPCGRFTGYSTAIFHRAMGVWRRALDAVSYACPVASIPVAVQTELGVCPPRVTWPAR
jgi:hypothetical protein